MHILSHIPFPELKQFVAQALPNAELSQLTDDQQADTQKVYDCLLTAAVGVPNLTQTLERYPSVRWVHVFGTGMDNFPIDQVGDRILTCSRGASATPISEWVMAMMLCSEKQLPEAWIQEPPETWHQTRQLSSLSGQQLSIFGFGGIGKALAKRALAFDMKVSALTRSSAVDMPGVTQCDKLLELVANADHLVLAAPSTPATRLTINADILSKMKPTAHIVNIARGDLIDQDALRTALDSEQIRLASLDTATPEPLPAGHWLYSHPRVRLSPHLSWSDPSAFSTLLNMFLDNLMRFDKGQPLNGIVDIQEAY